MVAMCRESRVFFGSPCVPVPPICLKAENAFVSQATLGLIRVADQVISSPVIHYCVQLLQGAGPPCGIVKLLFLSSLLPGPPYSSLLLSPPPPNGPPPKTSLIGVLVLGPELMLAWKACEKSLGAEIGALMCDTEYSWGLVGNPEVRGRE